MKHANGNHAPAAITWTHARRRLADLVPWEHNPRLMKKEEAARLLESLETFGQVHAIAVGPQNQIYDGHQRDAVWAASNRFGPDYEVDVRVANRTLTDKERGKLVVYLHKGTAGEFDFDALANLPEVDIADLTAWGFDESELLGAGGDLSENADEQPPDLEIPFGLRYGPDLIRRLGVNTIGLCIYHGDQETIDAFKAWKKSGDPDITNAVAKVIIFGLNEIGLDPAFITTPQRRHKGFHAATTLCQIVSKNARAPFMDLFGYAPATTGSHPARAKNADPAQIPPVRGTALVLDDLATSGRTMQITVKALRDNGQHAIGMVFLHYYPH